MENVYVILVVVLFVLAISDLVVGVSNDAVNFLNSALGSKAASFKVIMIIAAIGIFIGATFSSGMMEVARKGIFNPQYFYFSEIMIIFLAVMITDVLLLDLFNTFGMPTSTTVSIVFELLGGAIAISVIKVSKNPDIPISEYINTAKALAIISGILLSVVVAFSVGAVVQYFTRLVFSFNYDARLKYLGALWGGIAITAITYFILIKGAKGASFMNEVTKDWIKENTIEIIGVCFLGWTFILQLMRMIFKIDILKLTVLVGTFALAMAFAGNDLVNFVGVPLAGFESFKIFKASGVAADGLLMESLAGKVKTDTYLLVIAGLIMVVTLWTSKKARSVVKTSLDLSRQQEGEERFGSSYLSRTIVHGVVNMVNTLNKFIPANIKASMDKQFDSSFYEGQRKELGDEAPAFDMLRASVNLVVASVLISMATSYQLPLSTTYVTFMVAMGSSLTDGAWGRESAVYRVTGVLSVIGGWFLTAFSAFTVCFVITNIIYFGGIYAVFVLIAMSMVLIYRTQIISKKRSASNLATEDINLEEVEEKTLGKAIFNKCTKNVTAALKDISELYSSAITCFQAENRKELKSKLKEVNQINKSIKKLKDNIYKTVKKLQESEIDSSLHYVQVIDYLRESAHALTFVAQPFYEHLDNNHSPFTNEQFKDVSVLKGEVQVLISKVVKMINSGNYDNLDNVYVELLATMDNLKDLRKKQLRRIKKEKSSTYTSMLYLNFLHETQNLMLHLGNVLKAQRDFGKYNNN
ncbi:inorganic phosphate transporter [Saccharicrinis fermentans]|uniref:Phosphate transporter n=1 Tax=Saccharicrinis fermentans DSM 9555 = JCM 21142 TaxID=869213 RepID=W7YJZ4_9BACT|nr:inorganic phosphate transporter [Saccharicrinis fermentans]GAF04861.1 phosphate transporter family protein [Saccharicrinis fermentans DSM 9555 = JCM 21142]